MNSLFLPGPGAGAGAKHRTPVVFCGDAGGMMALPAIETAARHDLPAVIVVLNDAALSAEYHRLVGRCDHPDIALIGVPDLADIATDLGATGYAVRDADDLVTVAARLTERPSGPVVVDCRIDRHVVNPKLH